MSAPFSPEPPATVPAAVTTPAPDTLPIIDLAGLESQLARLSLSPHPSQPPTHEDASPGPTAETASAVDALVAPLRRACREHGFFYLVGHGVDEGLQARLHALSHEFFALPESEKARIAMALGGRAWRGFFPVGGELTSGLPDQKEGIYFGEELSESEPRVLAGQPLFGPNLFPERPERLGPTVLEYMAVLTQLAHRVLAMLARSLSLPASYFYDRYTREPLTLFRIFHYPPLPIPHKTAAPLWSVGEHTDYGLLTLLLQDDCGGLQVKTPRGWIEAPPVPNSFVCNIGDMLDRMTGGFYRSTPHRVKNLSGRGRLSFPFFFDPNMEARIRAIDVTALRQREAQEGSLAQRELPAQGIAPDRWDQQDVYAFEGRYGDWVQSKVAKVFPELWGQVAQE